MSDAIDDVITEIRGHVGCITLNRPKALNALSLGMIRALTATLRAWQDDPAVAAVAIRGANKEGPFGAFCAGGDIRFFHQAALAGDASLEDFFTEEYSLNHLIHTYRKPYIAFMDGIVMGGGMGLSQGATLRMVTGRTKMAMPETNIGLFPDVGGGYFLSRTPGHAGEFLALTGQVIGGREAVALGLADGFVEADALPALWSDLGEPRFADAAALVAWLRSNFQADDGTAAKVAAQQDHWDRFFCKASVGEIARSLEAAARGDDPAASEDGSATWARETLATLRKRSPLMLAVTLEQIRRGRAMPLADDLRMERDMVHRCFHLRPGAASETVEGIRALAVDKDHTPRWDPSRIEDVTPGMVAPFFASPWQAARHPLHELA